MYYGVFMGGFMVLIVVCFVLLIFIYKVVNWLFNIIIYSYVSYVLDNGIWYVNFFSLI